MSSAWQIAYADRGHLKRGRREELFLPRPERGRSNPALAPWSLQLGGPRPRLASAIVLDVIAVQSLLPAGLAEALRKAPLSDEKVALAWRIAVGPAVDHASRVTLKHGVLQVIVSRAEWQREIRRSSSLIRPRLDAFLGDGVVRAVKVSLQEQP